MKKIALFIAFIMCGLFVQAQNTQLETATAKEMVRLEKIVTYEHKNLTFNKNQTAKLERLLHKKSIEIIDLKNNKEVEKAQFPGEYRKIQDKYKPLVEAILSPAQKIEFRRNINKRII